MNVLSVADWNHFTEFISVKCKIDDRERSDQSIFSTSTSIKDQRSEATTSFIERQTLHAFVVSSRLRYMEKTSITAEAII